MREYTPTILRFDFERKTIRKLVEYGVGVPIVFSKDRFYDNRKNRFMLVSRGRDRIGGVWVQKVLLLFTVSIRGSTKSQKYKFWTIRR